MHPTRRPAAALASLALAAAGALFAAPVAGASTPAPTMTLTISSPATQFGQEGAATFQIWIAEPATQAGTPGGRVSFTAGPGVAFDGPATPFSMDGAGGPIRWYSAWGRLASQTGLGIGVHTVTASFSTPIHHTRASASAQITITAPAPRTAAVVGAIPSAYGYSEVGADGAAYSFGQAPPSHGPLTLNAPVVGSATPTYGAVGYWEVAADGGIFSFTGAHFYGSMGGHPLNQPIVGMAATPTGGGYWEVAADGGIFAFGNAGFYGSMGGQALNAPIVGMAATATGKGYWEVAADGGIFAFGNAGFYGSAGAGGTQSPFVGMAAANGPGYWLVAADGAVDGFGPAAPRLGQMLGEATPAAPIVAIVASPQNQLPAPTWVSPAGYWLIGADGGVFSFGGAPFYGSAASLAP